MFKSNFTEFVADRLGMEGARDLLCLGGSVNIIYFICWCSFNNDLWSKAFPFAASKTRISFSIRRGKTYLKSKANNLRFIFRLYNPENHYVDFELMLFIYWLSRDQILWIIRCPRVRYLHKWFSLPASLKTNRGEEKVESLINMEFFVCVCKWTISQQTLVWSIDVPLSPKINIVLKWQTNYKCYKILWVLWLWWLWTKLPEKQHLQRKTTI